jgi:hypothetical protein
VSKRPYIGPSESQSEALYRRESPYTEASGVSFRVKWDWTKREPRNVNEAVRMVRQAYSDEVPGRLHEGPDAIGEGGTPKMDVRAEAYIFGDDRAGHERPDPETGELPLVDFYRTPFRAALSAWQANKPAHAAVISAIALGGHGPMQATIDVGVPAPFAMVVADDTLRCFIRAMTDVKLRIPKEDRAA